MVETFLQLYTISTVVLVLQSLYYDHLYSWWKCKQIEQTQAVRFLILSSTVYFLSLNVKDVINFLRLKKRKNYWCHLSKQLIQAFQYRVAPPWCNTIGNFTTRNISLPHDFHVILYKHYFSLLKRRIQIIWNKFSGQQDLWLEAALHQLGHA